MERVQCGNYVKDTNNSTLIKKTYLVTIPSLRPVRPDKRLRRKTAVAGSDLRCPSSFTRADIERIFLDAARKPAYENQQHSSSVEMEQMAIFLEHHKPGEGSKPDEKGKPHFHVAVQANRSFRFAPLKRAIRAACGLETHWSSAHSGYHSALRYCALPSPKKPQADLDPKPRLWAQSGVHKPLFEACEEPVTIAAINALRERRVRAALEEGKSEPRPTDMDLYAEIVKGGFRNTQDDQHACKRLIAHLKATSSSLYAYAFKTRGKLAGFIDDVWAWETVGDALAMVSLPRHVLLARAAGGVCECGGAWRCHAEKVLKNNKLDPQEFFTCIVDTLEHGRGPNTKVPVLAGKYGGEGKSFLLAPLRSIYGMDIVQESPQPGNFPLLGLENKMVVLLDEWRFDESVLRMSTQLLWFEGKPFPLTRPQNQPGVAGHFLYSGRAPVFITTKAELLVAIQEAAKVAVQSGQPSQHTMLLRRLNIFMLEVPTPVLADGAIVECAVCFAKMAMHWSGRGQSQGVGGHASHVLGEIDYNDL